MRTMTIAEIGSCHDHNYNQAAELIAAAAQAGADYAKAQYWSSAKRLAERRKSGGYYEAIYEHYRMPDGWLPLLADQAKSRGIGFMCTSYLEEDIAAVAPYVDHFKVASFEAADLDFIRAHYKHLQHPSQLLIVSTGLQDAEMLKRLRIERNSFCPDIRLLHCVSAYPASMESLNLHQIRAESLDGFSDHAAAGCLFSGALAVASGASILEVHLRLHETDPQNPDAPHALLPEQLAEYIRNVRTAETMMGNHSRTENPAEDAMRVYKVRP